MAKQRSSLQKASAFLSEIQFRYLLSLLGCTTIAFLLLGYFFFHINRADGIWSNIIASFISSIAIFVILYFAFTLPGIKLPGMPDTSGPNIVKDFYPRHGDVDWSAMINGAKYLDIVVHYYNRWVREEEEALARFFGRGGRLRIIMADPAIPETLAAVHQHFFANLTVEQLQERIAETERVLREIFRANASPHASLEVFYFPTALHYSFVLADGRDLFLSVYEQFRGRVIRSSVFNLDLRRDSGMEEYWIENVSLFIKGSRAS